MAKNETPETDTETGDAPLIDLNDVAIKKLIARATKKLKQEISDVAYAEQQRLMTARKSYNDRLASLAGNE